MFASGSRGAASSCAASLSILLAAASAAAGQSVIVVDASGAGDFTDLQPAFNAAAPGDIVLVRSVLNPGGTMDGKGLTLIGDTGDAPAVGKVYVLNVPAGQIATLRHVQAVLPGNMFEALKLQDDAGTVFVEDVELWGNGGGPFLLAATGLRIGNCAAVILNKCKSHGGFGANGSPYWPPMAGGHGLAVTDSQVSVTWCDFDGGSGTGGLPFGVAKAGDGINASGGYLFASGSSADGGSNVDCNWCGDEFASDGLHLEGGLAQYTDTTFAAGSPPPTTPPGDDIDAPPGMAQNLNEPTRILFVSSPVRYLEKVVLLYSGAPHDRVAVFGSETTAFLPEPSKAGVWHLGPPFAGPVVLGVADDTGFLKTTFRAPDFAPLQGLTLFLQGAVQDTAGGVMRLTGPTSLTMIDPAF